MEWDYSALVMAYALLAGLGSMLSGLGISYCALKKMAGSFGAAVILVGLLAGPVLIAREEGIQASAGILLLMTFAGFLTDLGMVLAEPAVIPTLLALGGGGYLLIRMEQSVFLPEDLLLIGLTCLPLAIQCLLSGKSEKKTKASGAGEHIAAKEPARPPVKQAAPPPVKPVKKAVAAPAEKAAAVPAQKPAAAPGTWICPVCETENRGSSLHGKLAHAARDSQICAACGTPRAG